MNNELPKTKIDERTGAEYTIMLMDRTLNTHLKEMADNRA